MKKFRDLACLLIASTALSRAADSSVEGKVKVIRGHYAEIEANLKSCRQVKHDLSGESAEGGELTAYLKDSSVRKLSAKKYSALVGP